MSNCKNCNQPLADGAQFCDSCGASTEAKVFCPQCGGQNVASDAHCAQCGTKLHQEEVAAAKIDLSAAKEKLSNLNVPKVDVSKLPIPKKYLPFIIGGVAVVLVGIIAITLLGGGSDGDKPLLYVKDDAMVSSISLTKPEPFEITEDLPDAEDYSSSTLSSLVMISDDGKRIFFPDDPSNDYFSDYTLFYRDITKASAEAVEVADGVASYTITPDGKTVFYLDEDGDLYSSNLKDSERIEKDVSTFVLSSDGKTLLFVTDDSEIYTMTVGKDAEEIMDAYDLDGYYISRDFSTLVYLEDGDLSTSINGKDTDIDEDVSDVFNISDDGKTFYYVKTEDYEINVLDYIDSNTMWNIYSDYYDDDDLADEIEYSADNYGMDLDVTVYEDVLYYYDGTTSVAVLDDDNYGYSYFTYFSDDVVIFAANDYSDPMDVEYYRYSYLLSDMSYVKYNSETVYFMYMDGVLSMIDEDDLSGDFYFSTDNSQMAYTTYDYDSGNYTIYTAPITNGEVGDSTKLEKTDSIGSIKYLNEDTLAYVIDTEYSCGTLYLNSTEVADDVYSYYIYTDSKVSNVYFLGDWDDSEGILCSVDMKGKTVTEICEDAYSYFPYGDDIMVRTSQKNGEYDLYLYTGKGDPTLIAEEVTSFRSFNDGYLILADTKNGESDLLFSSGKEATLVDEDVYSIISGSTVTSRFNSFFYSMDTYFSSDIDSSTNTASTIFLN